MDAIMHNIALSSWMMAKLNSLNSNRSMAIIDKNGATDADAKPERKMQMMAMRKRRSEKDCAKSLNMSIEPKNLVPFEQKTRQYEK
jgi:hypothetical protein